MTNSIERKFLGIVSELDFDFNAKSKFFDILDDLRNWDEHTFDHSIREAVNAYEFAIHKCAPVNMYFIPTALHDRGKRYISKEILRASSSRDIEWKEEYMEKMKNNVIYGYLDLMANGFPFSAGIALSHHRPDYPEEMPNVLIPYTKTQLEDIENVSGHIRTLDFYDSIVNRNNGRFYKSVDIKKTMIESLPKDKALIEDLYDTHVFSKR